ncbi:universal stress protein [Candidatus Obscuribacterales bacterium]|nr:universal stress protein [Candidatus Obscuribacterales bacterium]MBX3149687.1 universal stress protein [Candidatus Obscuribacterales bacterium]
MKVMLAVDQSDCSNMAVESVLKRKWPQDTKFEVMSVFEPLAMTCVGWNAAYMPVTMIDTEQELLKLRKEFVHEKVQELEKVFGKENVTCCIREGAVWPGIIERANEWGADLIVVGSHGRSGISKFFLGSTAEAIAGHAGCSVEIVKGHQPFESSIA